MSIKSWWSSIDKSTKFLISYPFWFLLIFGLFYWGRYWDLSVIGKYLDYFQRSIIMAILDPLIPNRIENYDIVINSNYRLVITPECNGFVPYFIYLSAILAYPKGLKAKLIWAIIGYFVFSFVNLIRLYVVTELVNRFGAEYFFYFHDIGGNALLVVTGMLLFVNFLKR